MTYSRRQFTDRSIKSRFPLYKFVRLVGNRDTYRGEEVEIIGWTSSRVRLRIPGSNYWILRAPKNLGKPYINTIRVIIR